MLERCRSDVREEASTPPLIYRFNVVFSCWFGVLSEVMRLPRYDFYVALSPPSLVH